jgi:hypothetical protein
MLDKKLDDILEGVDKFKASCEVSSATVFGAGFPPSSDGFA